MTANLTTNHASMLTPIFDEIIDKSFTEALAKQPPIFPDICKVHDPQSLNGSRLKNQFKSTSLGGFGSFSSVAEGTAIPTRVLDSGYTKTYSYVKYGDGIKASSELMDDDLYGELVRRVERLGLHLPRFLENMIAGVFRNAFSATGNAAGGDGAALVSDEHTPLNGTGSDQSNLGSGPLSIASLDAALKACAEMTDDETNPLPWMPRILLVPPALRRTARQLLGGVQESGTEQYSYNTFRDDIPKVIVHPLLGANYGGSDTSWFLLDPELLDINLFIRSQPVTEYDYDAATQIHSWYYSFRVAAGHNDWRGVFGSSGVSES